jgi:uncharacterized protein with GYD domain
MPRYVVLANFTDEGVRNIKQLPEWLKRGEDRLMQAGGRFISWHATQGAYDAVAIVEYPDDETATRALLALNREGNVRTTTLRAFPREEFEKIVASLP